MENAIGIFLLQDRENLRTPPIPPTDPVRRMARVTTAPLVAGTWVNLYDSAPPLNRTDGWPLLDGQPLGFGHTDAIQNWELVSQPWRARHPEGHPEDRHRWCLRSQSRRGAVVFEWHVLDPHDRGRTWRSLDIRPVRRNRAETSFLPPAPPLIMPPLSSPHAGGTSDPLSALELG